MRLDTIYRQLSTQFVGQSIVYFSSVSSTNKVALSLAGGGAPEGTVIIADYQTAGHGRQGRAWIADPDEGLLASIILRPSLAPADAFYLTMVPALSVLECIERLGVRGATLKWPNDVLVNGKKVAGILTEVSLLGDAIEYAVAGIGLNVNLDPGRHAAITDLATSLSVELGKPLERETVAVGVLTSFEAYYLRVESGDKDKVLAEWRGRLETIGRWVQVSDQGSGFRAFAVDVTVDGGLVLDRGGKRVVVYGGDVSLSNGQ